MATEKQLAYIDSLKAQVIRRCAPTLMTGKNDRARNALTTMLVLSLPTPTTTTEASEQIDALKGNVLNYARTHQDWYNAIAAKFAAAFGQDGAGVPKAQTNGAAWTENTWAAMLQEVLNGVA